jgi:transcriptional regulator with XRE-family HTH domain
METFATKVKKARETLKFSQQQLADAIGVSKRSVAAYETAGTVPRGNVARRLARALGVSVDYLLNDSIDDKGYGLEREAYITAAREKYGSRAAVELGALLEQNRALFAGGTIDQESKDAFFEALMKAYLASKEAARAAFGQK